MVFDAKPLKGASGLACLVKWQVGDSSDRIEEGVVRLAGRASQGQLLLVFARYLLDGEHSQTVMARSLQDSVFCEPVIILYSAHAMVGMMSFVDRRWQVCGGYHGLLVGHHRLRHARV